MPSGLWVRGEYLMWWTKGMSVPPLVTTGLEGDGVLGESDTVIRYGNDDILDQERHGFRIRAGVWLDCARTWGLEGDYFQLGEISDYFYAGTETYPGLDIYRPFFNMNPREEPESGQSVGAPTGPPHMDAQEVSVSGKLTGSVSVASYSEFSGAGGRLRRALCCWEGCTSTCDPCGGLCPIHQSSRLDFLVGYRYLQLGDSLHIRELLQGQVDTNLGTMEGDFDLNDVFGTRNEFHGADIGVVWEGTHGPWSLELLGKLALGSTRQRVAIDGWTWIEATPDTGDNGRYTGGLLTQTDEEHPGATPPNIGTYQRDVFAVVPELGVTLGCQLSPHLRATLGYSFIYWSRVVRAGEQIDFDVNPLLKPIQPEVGKEVDEIGPLRPSFTFRDTDFWAQGWNVGLELRY
jgi:hypothetical protein